MINCIEIDPFNKGGAYIVGTKYKSGDYKPYIYKTEDYGKTWKLIVNGIGNEDFTRALRADPKRKGLLYAGTEKGMYISFDDGANWQKFQLNLPIVPITDLAVKDDNLIAATQGRSFWIIDDLTPLRQLNNDLTTGDIFLYKPKDSYRMGGGRGATSKTQGQNHNGGVIVNFFVKDTLKKDTISLSFYDTQKKLIKKFSTHPDKEKKEEVLKVAPGANQFNWDMMYSGAEDFDGMILWWASLSGPMALPGNYTVELTKNTISTSKSFTILKDPRTEATLEDMQAQFDFIAEVRDKLTEIHKAIKNIRKVKGQITQLKKSVKDKEQHKELIDFADDISKRVSEIENNLYQTKNRSNQDPLNFPIKLNNKLGHLNSLTSMGNFKPTDQAIAFKDEVTKEIDAELSKVYSIFEKDVKELNQKVKDSGIDLIQLE
jgi:hypothetical protein